MITVIIHTKNEEKNIVDCINSVKLLSKKIVVIDMESQDKTVDLAKQQGVEVFSFPPSKYVEPARQFGIDRATTNWVLILDADERMTQELAEEINRKIKNEEFSYYAIPRKNIFSGKWLRHGGWWPDRQIRLIDRRFLKKWPEEIHSTPVIDGKKGSLDNYMIHYFHGNLEKMVEKTLIFEDIESELLFKAGREVSTKTFFRKFLGEFYRRAIKNKGFLDGSIGIIESIYQAFSKTITYLFLFEKRKDEKSSSL